MKIVNFEDIKTPQTIEEFRENLKKYFVCIGKDREMLMTRGKTSEVKVDEISSFSDLYKLGVERITPTIRLDANKLTTDETMRNMFSRDFSSVLSDRKRFPIREMNSAEDTMKFIQTKNPHWYTMDNQILRAFYVKTLGEFSGYSTDMSWS
jgi:hypothetical protein